MPQGCGQPLFTDHSLEVALFPPALDAQLLALDSLV
jgi:hypothetical protein